MAKINIKAVTASKQLTPDQSQILRRVAIVLIEHGFSVEVRETKKIKTTLKIKRA
jgi:hypothetical protein